MEQEEAYSEKGKKVCYEWPSLVSPSPVGTLSSPASLLSTPSIYPCLLQKGFLRRVSLLRQSLGRRDHQKGSQTTKPSRIL